MKAKAILFSRVRWSMLVLLAVSSVLASCNTTGPRRDELSPQALQWQTLRRAAR